MTKLKSEKQPKDQIMTGDAYDRAYADLNKHIGGCPKCPWLGDYCAIREGLMDKLAAARAEHLKHENRRAVEAGKATTIEPEGIDIWRETGRGQVIARSYGEDEAGFIWERRTDTALGLTTYLRLGQVIGNPSLTRTPVKGRDYR